MLNVIIGLFGLGLVVFLHELGHLLAAKWMGVTVEAFSVGWGPKIWSFERGGTDYRISWLPIGGYCKMKGERALLKAWQERSSRIDVEDGDFYAARPWQRIVVLFAGPAINYLFAILVFAAIALVGYTMYTYENRIVLAADYYQNSSPAALAGLQTGDRIVEIDGDTVNTFRDIQTIVSRNAEKELLFTIQREGHTMEIPIEPALVAESGAGQIGVFPWVEPVVEQVGEETPAEIAGILPGDRIVAVDGTHLAHSVAIDDAIRSAGSNSVVITVDRDGAQRDLTLVPGPEDQRIGLYFETLEVRTPRYGPVAALIEGVRTSNETLALTIHGIGLLFRGVDLNRALMGPVRITYLVGEVATESLSAGLGSALLSFFNFLSLISITLFFMNLLPIPVLDGGQILLSLLEVLRRQPLNPRLVYHYQMIGNIIVIGLMFFAFFNDIVFFAGG